MFKATAITLIPEAWPGPLGASILGRARAEGIWDLETVDLRQFGLGKQALVRAAHPALRQPAAEVRHVIHHVIEHMPAAQLGA